MLSRKTFNYSQKAFNKRSLVTQKTNNGSTTVLLAVSGTLQEGFPLNKHLDHPETKAVFVGWGLIRGVKSYFDIKTKNSSREFTVRRTSNCFLCNYNYFVYHTSPTCRRKTISQNFQPSIHVQLLLGTSFMQMSMLFIWLMLELL